jgi:hypothetical protein
MIKLKHHATLDPQRWYRFSLVEQLGNVGSDVERTISWRKKGNPEQSRCAFERVLELIDLTVSDPKNKGRLREVLRVREALVDYFVYDNIYNSSDALWQKYFYDYAYAAAVRRGK